MRAILYYNENKVADGEARLILASGFAGDVEAMGREQKMMRFNHLLRLKPNVKTHAVHITLNFHSSEKLTDEKLQQIGLEYMERIGFGDQPFLVYRHLDSAHTHLHIVTTNITAGGKRIDLHNIGVLKSEPARKIIEQEYGLVKAEGKGESLFPKIKKIDARKVSYGRLPTKRAISNVLVAVNRDYRFTSLAEYNAVLKCFNVMAIRGEEHTAMFERKGLIYSVIDGKGQQLGVPIKASAFSGKPTLRNLEARFAVNSEKRKPYRQDLKQRIEKVFVSRPTMTRGRFLTEMERQGISVVFRQNEQRQVFGITYVDHQNGCVFNGSDLGKAYSANAISERLISPVQHIARSMMAKLPSRGALGSLELDGGADTSNDKNLLEELLTPVGQDYGTGVPRRKKKKKKQQQISI
ncbi:relaxase/mobilization nuclease domain-containing protein [Pedobacter sp.]